MKKNRLKLFNVLKTGIICLALCFIGAACDKNDDNPNNQDNHWVQKANYPGAAVADAIAFSINDKIYVGMGHNATGGKNDLWEYDPSTNKWTEKQDLPVINESDLIEYFIANNKAYVLVGNKTWEYNPANDNWTQKADYPSMIFPSSFTYAFSTENKGYVGGVDGLFEYNPDTDTWKKCADFTGLNRRGITAVSNGQNGYIIGGNGIGYPSFESELCSDNFWTYSPGNDKWSQKADYPSGTGLVYGISFSKENSIYAGLGIGSWQTSGSASSSDTYNYIGTIYKYDADNNSWVQAIIPPVSKRCQAIGVICNGKLYIGLGAYLYPHPFSSTEYFLDFWEYSF